MENNKRNVEVYIGEGGDYGTWGTEYVEIPRETPENEIEALAINQAKIDYLSREYAFIGIYSIPSLDDSDEMYENEF
jgi:hypothetical protein